MIKTRYLFVVLLLAVSLIGIQNSVFSATTVTIDPNTKYVTFEGWGCSLCWFADGLGDWSDTNRNAIADLLFASSGLGFNVVRYNIGGGENPSHTHMRENANIPGFQPSAGVWDWNADARQRWFLSAAKSRGANILEAFSNSPPYWMTKSNCTSGNTDGSNNLKDDYYDDFAEYLTEVVKHFRDSWSTTFQTLDPMNEPMGTWWTSGGRQEGCHFERANQVNLIKQVGAKLASKGLSTKVSASDECSIDDAVASLNYYDSAALGYITQVNTHAYGGSQRSQLYSLAQSKGKKLWMSEYGNGGEDINGALTLTGTIIKDLREMKPSVWAHWQPIENENLVPTWGMIHARFSGAEDYHITKQYYGMANFSKFIRPGYDIIASSDANTVCAYSASAQKLIIVIRNSGTSDLSYTFDMNNGFSSVGSSATPYRTSGSENLATLSNLSISNKLLYATVKAQSITTYVIPSVVKGGNPTPTPTLTPTPTRSRVTATPTPTSAATPTPTQGGGSGNYVVTYTISNDWGSGATINVTIKNNTTAAVNGWNLAWTFPGNQTISSLWCGTYTQSGASVTVSDGGSISANGGTVTFGFNINYSGTNAKPASFTLNGTACQVQ
jgi:O-glycosyl hydrolase